MGFTWGRRAPQRRPLPQTGLLFFGTLLTVWLSAPCLGQDWNGTTSPVWGHTPVNQPSWNHEGAYEQGVYEAVPPVETVFTPAPESERPWIKLDTSLTWNMLDFQNRQGDKEILLLQHLSKQDQFPQVILGAQFRASGLVARTNTTDKFSYLGRFPPDFNGNDATDLRLLQANQAVVLQATPWATGYFETLFSDVFTFPSFNQGSFQVRQAYLVLGDLNRSPFYGFIGKKNISFGDMRTLAPFSQTAVWHYFGPLAEGGGLGFTASGLNLTFTALNGSRGIRVSDSEKRGHINNFAANASYEFEVAEDVELMVGGGYLHGTIYDGSVAEHINPAITGPRNAAWDVNTRVGIGPVVLSAEYVQTLNPWPVTNHVVQAYRTEAGLQTEFIGKPLWISGSWSEGIQGPGGSTFEKNSQLILGMEFQPAPNLTMTFEYVRNLGFAPLLDITTVSDPDVIQNSLVFGLVLAI